MIMPGLQVMVILFILPELHKIAVLTDKKRPFYLTWNIAYPKEDFVEFNYIVRGDDEENRILLFIVLIKRL